MEFIHARKCFAGMRLALLALDKTYGISGITSQSAYYKNMVIKRIRRHQFRACRHVDLWQERTEATSSKLRVPTAISILPVHG